MVKRLRQKLNDKVEKYGNKIYDGLGDILNTETSPKGLTSLVCVGVIGLGAGGCVTCDKPNLQGKVPITREFRNEQGFGFDIVRDLDVARFNEKDSPYQGRGLMVFGEGFYVVNTDLGGAMFRLDKSYNDHNFTKGEEEKILVTAYLASGENGMYFLENARMNETTERLPPNKEGYMADTIKVDPRTRKATVEAPKIIKERGGLGIFFTTEGDLKWNLEFAKIPQKGWHHVVRVEPHKVDKNESDFYNFYLTPIIGSTVRVKRKTGQLEIKHFDEIYRPTFKCWDQIEKALMELDPEQRKANRAVFEHHGMPPITASELEHIR